MIRLKSKDIIWSYIGTILSIFSNIIMLPFILHFLSGDEYGLWSIFQSIGGITVLFDFGFSNFNIPNQPKPNKHIIIYFT